MICVIIMLLCLSRMSESYNNVYQYTNCATVKAILSCLIDLIMTIRAMVKGLSDLILAVMVGSEAVLFHREMMSSVGLMDMTTPHISSPTMNCSPKMASSCITSWNEKH